MGRARRLKLRPWRGLARRARLVLGVWLASQGAGLAVAQEITAADYTRPTTAYPHGVLGDEIEWEAVRITVKRQKGEAGELFEGHLKLTYEIKAPDRMVFEDIAPRLWDIDGDGKPEVVVVASHQEFGAQLAVIGYRDGAFSYVATTPTIGQRFRWLAPVGAADLDGDGHIEVAMVVTPHLAKTLTIWRYKAGDFREVARRSGLTNHKIGWDFIAGGLRDCGDGPEMITANADWSRVIATTFTGRELRSRGLTAYKGPASLTTALDCR